MERYSDEWWAEFRLAREERETRERRQDRVVLIVWLVVCAGLLAVATWGAWVALTTR